MKAISVNPNDKSINEIDIEMQANTVYTFFSSILIDELSTIKDHIIYTDANALSEKKTPYFIGEQLVIGDALIAGQSTFDACDISIPTEQLKSLVSYDVSQFYKDVFELISSTDVNLYRPFDVMQDGANIQLNIEWVFYVFNMADDKTREYFLDELKKSLDSNDDTTEFMKRMAQLAVNSAA